MDLRRIDDDTGIAWEVCHHERALAAATVQAGSEPTARFLRLEVDPQHRGRGIGSWLIGTIIDELRAAGVEMLETLVVTGSAGARFATRHGATSGDHLVTDILDLTRADRVRLSQLVQDLPGEYVLQRWHGHAPPSLINSYAQARKAIRDAPNRYPPPVPEWTPAAIRKSEQHRAQQGESPWVTAATLDGQVVAFTEALTTESPDAEQHDTAVVRAHRRRGLAGAVKADLILRLCRQRPDLRSLAVTYALSNTGMQAVNRELGFEELHRRDLVRLPL